MHKTDRKPWYREPWPWILMTGPLIVVVAGCFTAWIAYTKGDPLVTDDYYLKGLAAKQTLASSERAEALGLQARVRLAGDQVELRLQAIDARFAPPQHLRLTLSHPTRAGLDQIQVLELNGNVYRGPLRVPQSGHWLLQIEDDLQSWRLLGKVVLPDNADVVIGRPDANGVSAK